VIRKKNDVRGGGVGGGGEGFGSQVRIGNMEVEVEVEVEIEIEVEGGATAAGRDCAEMFLCWNVGRRPSVRPTISSNPRPIHRVFFGLTVN